MDLTTLLTPGRCYCGMDWSSKKHVLNTISELLEQETANPTAADIYPALMAREQLGSTGLGNGIAIPHCRIANCQRIIGALITLQQPIEYDAADGKPVDLLLVMMVPERRADEHVHTLAGLAGLFHDHDFCARLRAARDNRELYRIATSCAVTTPA